MVKKRKQATSNNISNSGGNVAIVDDDVGWVRPIKVDNEDEDDVKEAVVASDGSFKKRRRVMGEDGGWISLPPQSQEQAQEVEVDDEKPVVINQDTQPQMTGGLMSHADLEGRFTTTQLVKKAEGPTKEQMETVYRDATGRKIDAKAARQG
jgi:pre-mRNA-splicing factor CWC26